MHAPYPPFSLDCVRELYRIITSGAIRTEIKLFAKCTYELVGSGLALVPGEPEDVQPIFGEVGGDGYAELDKLQHELVAVKEVGLPPEMYGASDDAAIDPSTLMLLIDLALKLIQAIRNRRKK
jgi:hypothetical protein